MLGGLVLALVTVCCKGFARLRCVGAVRGAGLGRCAAALPMEDEACVLFVRNVDYSVEIATLRSVFEDASSGEEIVKVSIPRDHATGRGRGIAYVTLRSHGAADAARVALDGATLRNRRLSVVCSRAPKKRSVALNKQLTDSTSSVEEVLALFAEHSSDFNDINIATALHRLGVLAASGSVPAFDDARLLALVGEAADRVEAGKFGAREVANACWGAAKMRLAAPELFEATSLLPAGAIASGFTPQALANTAWAFASTGVEAPLLFGAIATAAVARTASFESRDFASLAWAFATAGVDAPLLFEKLASEALPSLADFSSHSLANMAWAFATAGKAQPRLFDALALASRAKIRDFNPQELANLAWAYAASGIPAPLLFEAIAVAAAPRACEFAPHGLSSLVWAFATAAQGTQSQLGACDVDTATTEWTLATTGASAPALFEAVAWAAAARLEDFKTQDFANIAWAFATADVAAPELFAAIAEAAFRRGVVQRDFNRQALATVAWAFAKAGIEAPELFEAIAFASLRQLDQFAARDIATLAWAFATADVPAVAVFEALGALAPSRVDEFAPQALGQLHQVALWCRLEQPSLLAPFEPQHAARYRAAFVTCELKPSRSQKDIALRLDRMGWPHEFEHVTQDGLSLDMAQPDRKRALEFDGPSHYLHALSDLGVRPGHLNGKTRFKMRLLRALGWHVVHIPYFQWYALKSTREQDAFLRARLAEFDDQNEHHQQPKQLFKSSETPKAPPPPPGADR